jgi:hypothetical protein
VRAVDALLVKGYDDSTAQGLPFGSVILDQRCGGLRRPCSSMSTKQGARNALQLKKKKRENSLGNEPTVSAPVIPIFTKHSKRN